MSTVIRFFRVIVGLIAIWQVFGLLPIFTWLSNLHAVTVGMWITVAIKSFFMILFGGIYFWLEKFRNRIDDSNPAKKHEYEKWPMKMEKNIRSDQRDLSPSAADMQADYDFILYPSKKKMALGFLGCIIFVAIGLGLFMEGEAEESWFYDAFKSIAIYLGVPFVGLCGIFYFSRLVNPSPSIVITENGVQVMTFGGAALRWSEIADMRIEEYQKNRFLVIYPKTPETLMRKQSLWGKVATKLTALLMERPPAIIIAEALVGMSLEELVGEMMSRRPSE